MGILRILLLFAFALIPFGQIVRVQISSGIIISPLDVIVFLLSFYLLLFATVKKKFPHLEFFHYFLIAFLCIGLLSLFIRIPNLNSSEFLSSLGYFIRFVMYIVPLFLLPNAMRIKGQSILAHLVFAGFIFVVFGVIQYIFLPRLELLIFLGEWDIHSFRLFSTFFDPNYAGLFIALEIMLLYAFLHKKSSRKTLYLIMLVISYIALFLTYSRSSIIALAAGTFFFFLIQKKYKVLFGFVSVFLFSLVCLYFYSLQFRGEGVKLFRTASVHTRLSSYQEGINIFIKYPVLGSGFNTYKYARKNFSDLEIVDKYSNASNAPSNSYIFILATTGIFGFGFFSCFLLFLARNILLLRKQGGKDVFPVSMFGSLIIILTHAMFQNSLFYSPIVIVYVLLFVGGLQYSYSRE